MAVTAINPFATILLRWYDENRRDLPWRNTHDPYAIWLSEVILQQTRIQQGWDYWERFMHRWPTVDQLAAATEDEVLREWQGLGYYSRARNLHAAAQQIVEMGRFPDNFDDIRKLKGVGDYTAAAIASIAFGQSVAVVDGNVYRVLSRYLGIDTPINTTAGKRAFTAVAQELLSGCDASAFNQAMMDFGALQCTPQSPRCLLCPLQETCTALRTGRVEQLPVKKKTLKVTERHLTYIYIRCHGETAIRRRGPGDIWQGLWEPLEGGELMGFQGLEHLQSAVASPSTATSSPLVPVAKGVRHVLTHRVLLADFYLWEVTEKPPLPDEYIWIKEEDLTRYALSRLVERLVELL